MTPTDLARLAIARELRCDPERLTVTATQIGGYSATLDGREVLLTQEQAERAWREAVA